MMGMALHYSLLVAFMWTLIEGIDFIRKIDNVFDSWTPKMTFCYVFHAYFIPLAIVIFTVLVAVLTDEDVLDVYGGSETYTCYTLRK